MTNTSAIKKDFSQEQDKKIKYQVKVARSPFRYNSQYSNLAFEAIRNNDADILSEMAAIDKTIDYINEKFKELVEQEINQLAEKVINLNDLGSDLEETDLDVILKTNNQWTNKMTLEAKQSQVVSIIGGLGEGSLEYKMAVARRLQLTKTKVFKYLEPKLTHKIAQEKIIL